MDTAPNPDALEAMRRKLIADMDGHVRGMLDQALPNHPPGDVQHMAVLIFEMSDPRVHQLVSQYVMNLPPPVAGPRNIGAAIVRRTIIPILAAAATPEGQPAFDCAPIMAAPNIPTACMAFGGMTVSQPLARPGSA